MADDKIISGYEGFDRSAPIGQLGLIAVKGTEELAAKVDSYLVDWRTRRETEHTDNLLYAGYKKDSYIVDAECIRFGTGEGKGTIKTSIRGNDIYFIVDVTNYSSTYRIGAIQNHYSADDHYQDLKRLISAAAGSAKRINVIMPFLYEGRVDKRSGRESLDCASMLQELTDMGVKNIITFDAHEPRVQNAIPLNDFETITPTYQYVKALTGSFDDLNFDSEHMMIISPDINGMARAIFFANMLGLDIGMYYRRRDYSRMVNGEYAVVDLEFLGPSVEGKDVIILDDMISSGGKMLEVARDLKKLKARRVFCCATYGLFSDGGARIQSAVDAGYIDKVFTTNLIYQKPEILEKEWYESVDMSKYIALIIDSLNHDGSISDIINPVDRISRALESYRNAQAEG